MSEENKMKKERKEQLADNILIIGASTIGGSVIVGIAGRILSSILLGLLSIYICLGGMFAMFICVLVWTYKRGE